MKQSISISKKRWNELKNMQNEVTHNIDTNNSTIKVSGVFNQQSQLYERSSIRGFADRNDAKLMIYPTQQKVVVCHLIPFKYIGTENDSRYVIGGTKQLNQDMREAERQLDEYIEKGYNVYYSINTSINNKHQLKMIIDVIPFTDNTLGHALQYSYISNDIYIFDESMEYSKETLNQHLINLRQATVIHITDAFSYQWNEYKTTIQTMDGRNIEGVQVTSNTFVDIDMNKYYHEKNSTILDQITGKNWIYSRFIQSILNATKDFVAYVENHEDKMILHVIEDKNNIILTLDNKLNQYLSTFDLSDVIKVNDYTYELYRKSHSRLFEKIWELQPNEFVPLDETTMTIYPAEQENGEKQGIEFKNKAGMLVTGQTGSGKTESVKTMLMSFINSPYVDIGIIDMKASYDWEPFKDYIDILINNGNVGYKGNYYLNILLIEIRQRNKQLKDINENNFWNIKNPKDRPFNFKVIIIDELHKLMSYRNNNNHRRMYSADLLHYILRESRNVGIFIIGITQLNSHHSLGYQNKGLFNINIHFRNEIVYNYTDSSVINKLHSIPLDSKGVGVGLIEGFNTTNFVRFGYYPSNHFSESLSKIKTNENKKVITTKFANDDANVLTIKDIQEHFDDLIYVDEKDLEKQISKNKSRIQEDEPKTHRFTGANIRKLRESRKKREIQSPLNDSKSKKHTFTGVTDADIQKLREKRKKRESQSSLNDSKPKEHTFTGADIQKLREKRKKRESQSSENISKSEKLPQAHKNSEKRKKRMITKQKSQRIRNIIKIDNNIWHLIGDIRRKNEIIQNHYNNLIKDDNYYGLKRPSQYYKTDDIKENVDFDINIEYQNLLSSIKGINWNDDLFDFTKKHNVEIAIAMIVKPSILSELEDTRDFKRMARHLKIASKKFTTFNNLKFPETHRDYLENYISSETNDVFYTLTDIHSISTVPKNRQDKFLLGIRIIVDNKYVLTLEDLFLLDYDIAKANLTFDNIKEYYQKINTIFNLKNKK